MLGVPGIKLRRTDTTLFLKKKVLWSLVCFWFVFGCDSNHLILAFASREVTLPLSTFESLGDAFPKTLHP